VRIVTEFPHRFNVTAHTWIEMSDGCRLSGKLWIPDDALEQPVPAILEYIPYRKDDFTAIRDHSMHAWFAGHGYASARVDLRGSGDSEGILTDEYLPLEQSDGIEVIRWLAGQPWCNGRVGMIGISWGGFNALQIAAHSPPELGAVISVGSTVDRYAEDVHYIGGAVHGYWMLSWASTMLAFGARPPDPALVGESWREMWLERLDGTSPFIDPWLGHQRRSAYWKQGSVCEDYSAITCPVYMVSGWDDTYRGSVLKYLQGAVAPAKGLIGPWGHQYPHEGTPGPEIGFLQECVRYFDRHLKGLANGIDDEPRLRVMLQEPVRPERGAADRVGHWVALNAWPPAGACTIVLRPDAGGSLGESVPLPATLSISSDPVIGVGGGRFGGWTSDQGRDDSRSLTFTSEPLAEDISILGTVHVRLEVSSDRPVAQVCARLCHLWPDGTSTRITGGVLNLTHRDSDEEPEALEPGRRYLIDVEMTAMSYICPRGHRLRLSVSAGYWPLLWPCPERFRLSVHTGEHTAVVLPVLDLAQTVCDVPDHFAGAAGAPPLEHETLGGLGADRLPLEVRHQGGAVELVTGDRDRHFRLGGSGLEYFERDRNNYRIVEGDPRSAEVRVERHIELSRGEWRTRVQTSSKMSATGEHFLVTDVLDAYEGDERVFTRSWSRAIPRDAV
jgi:putative CocE/NonD family hydrolase